MKFLGMNIVPMLNPLKFSITTPLNFQNMQSVSMPVQVFWNLELIPIKGNWFSSKHFCRVRHCPVCQWRRSLLWRAVMFQQLPSIQERFPTHRWVFLTLTVKNPPVTELRDTLKHMNDSWQRLIQTKRFKSGVAGFLNNRSHQGEWWGHDGTSTLSCFAVG